MYPDCREPLSALNAYHVEYLVVGLKPIRRTPVEFRGTGDFAWQRRVQVNVNPDTDLELVDNRPPTARSPIESIFEETHGLVFRTAYRMTGSAADAEDVLQQVFLRLLRRNSSEPLDNQESYLRRAAINLSIDAIRKRQESRSVPLDEAPQLYSADEQDRRTMRDSLRCALATLNPREAEVFALRHFEGYKNQEIAKMLGLSQVQVAVLLFRTRKQLQKEIERQSKQTPRPGARQ